MDQTVNLNEEKETKIVSNGEELTSTIDLSSITKDAEPKKVTKTKPKTKVKKQEE